MHTITHLTAAEPSASAATVEQDPPYIYLYVYLDEKLNRKTHMYININTYA